MKNFGAYSLLLTENCNMGCKYCYEVTSTGHRKVNMSEETALQAVRFMFESSKNDPSVKEISVTFFGGEPTLMPDIIDIFCTEGKALSKTYNKPFYASMITNATVMNEKLYNIIKKHLDIWGNCQLSIDGPHEIQDSYRVYKNGTGSFSTIEKNMPYWKELFGDRINIHGVLNSKSIGKLFDSYIFFRKEWGVDKLWFLPAKDVDFDQESVDSYDREMSKIYNHIMEEVRITKDLKEIQYYAPLDRSLRDGKMGKPCGAGDNYCVITSEGDIWPCHHFYFADVKKELKMGDIFNGVSYNRKRIWEEYDVSDLRGCEDCEHPSCYRCIAENYEKNGTPFTQLKGKHCDFMFIDMKYQKLIREEVESMGLIKKGDNKGGGAVTDCVGKQGDCPIVTSVEECIFDRGEMSKKGPKEYNQLKPLSMETTEEISKKFDETPSDFDITKTKGLVSPGCSGCCDKAEKTNKDSLKEFLDDMIKLLIKYHNRL